MASLLKQFCEHSELIRWLILELNLRSINPLCLVQVPVVHMTGIHIIHLYKSSSIYCHIETTGNCWNICRKIYRTIKTAVYVSRVQSLTNIDPCSAETQILTLFPH